MNPSPDLSPEPALVRAYQLAKAARAEAVVAAGVDYGGQLALASPTSNRPSGTAKEGRCVPIVPQGIRVELEVEVAHVDTSLHHDNDEGITAF